MAQAVRHLVALGHRDIAYAGGPLPSWSDRTRRGAFLDITGADDTVRAHELGSFMPYFSGGVAAADLLLASPATAVVVFNDLMRSEERRVGKEWRDRGDDYEQQEAWPRILRRDDIVAEIRTA